MQKSRINLLTLKDRTSGIEFDLCKVSHFTPFRNGKVIFGGYFGDEGKGKEVDIVAEQYRKKGLKILSCSGQAGGNSGHTVVADGKKYDFHYLTSAGLVADIMLLGPGKLIDPIQLLKEMEQLPEEKRNIVQVAKRATIVSKAEKKMDAWCEKCRGENAIGTTKSGIGPAVGNKGYRFHVTFADVLGENFEKTFEDFKMLMCENPIYPNEVKTVLTDEYLKELWEAINKLNIVDSEMVIQNCRNSRKYAVLLEVAQAICLDPSFGNGGHYTTSTPCSPTGGMAGMGLSHKDFPDGATMVIKAYGSKVGGGPYITKFSEDEQEIANVIYKLVGECGVTTGRKRDLGWLDGPAIRHSIALTGADVFVNCLDIIPCLKSVTDTVKVCFAYRNKTTGEVTYDWPYDLNSYEPLYAEMTIKGLSDKEIIQNYILFIEMILGSWIAGYGVGPTREDYRRREDAFR